MPFLEGAGRRKVFGKNTLNLFEEDCSRNGSAATTLHLPFKSRASFASVDGGRRLIGWNVQLYRLP